MTDQVGSGKDRRPWRTVTFSMPEDVAVKVEEALALAKGFGLASNRIEAIEAVCVEFSQQYMLSALLSQADAEGKSNLYKVNSIQTLIDTGFRCVECEHSRDLTIHHIWPRGYYGPGRPENIDCLENLAPLCIGCHEIIQPKWRDHVIDLQEKVLAAKRQVVEYGYRMTYKHTKGEHFKWV